MKPQLVPSQVAAACAGGEQGVHEEPQLATFVSSKHAPEQSWKPLTQENPHAAGVPLQVGIALATLVMQAVLDAT